MRIGCLLLALVIGPLCQAEYLEIGGAINYRRSAFDSDNYQDLISYTGSFSYYFSEQSAIELSYTNGFSDMAIKIPNDPTNTQITTETFFQLAALDFVFSLGSKDDTFQPYVKIGGGYLKKQVYEDIDKTGYQIVTSQEGLVPSGGLGFRLMITKTVGVKIGVDAWTTPPAQQPVTVDYAGSLGFSWMF